MRYTTAGESHGRALVTIVTDVPAGIPLQAADIDGDLARRQVGYGRGGRMKIETDRAAVLSGIRFGRTLGTPIALSIGNRDWDNWTDVMSTWGEPVESARVTAPRPGHADLSGIQKIGSRDVRDILERASARETAARVAAGAIGRALLREMGVSVSSCVTRIGDVEWSHEAGSTTPDTMLVEASDVRCPDAETSARMRQAIDDARAAGESLGGVFVVSVTGLVPGLGGYAQADQRLDARLGAAVLSIPAIKGVEFGDGFALAARPGSLAHDAIRYEVGEGFIRDTNRAGGLEGGMTNGEPLVVRAAMKPIPTLMTPLASVDIDTLDAIDASRERSDVCAVPAAAVVAEAEVALVLANAYAEKFGGDSVTDMRTALDVYRARIAR
ncbi:MAG: chorismate synthase [Actinobacteria bacterium HGW-Actinobacteria-1]|jgi:chorismate synthase|nr:MAG: chorismate synthase [Actinobacteria bacterium HGW-Actinobacteria-1]